MIMRVLILGAKPGLATLLRKRLVANGAIVVCDSIIESNFDWNDFDAILLDLDAASGNRAAVYDMVRTVASGTPILPLSGANDIEVRSRLIRDGGSYIGIITDTLIQAIESGIKAFWTRQALKSLQSEVHDESS